MTQHRHFQVNLRLATPFCVSSASDALCSPNEQAQSLRQSTGHKSYSKATKTVFLGVFSAPAAPEVGNQPHVEALK